MLNEIFNSIGDEVILNTIKGSIDMSNSLCVKMPIDKELEENDFLLIKKEVEINQLKQSEWFKERELLSKYINSNKAIVQGNKNKYPKMISSIHENAILVNWDNFIKHKNNIGDMEQCFKTLVKEYLDILGLTDTYFEYYSKNIGSVIDFIDKNNLTKISVKLFLDVDLENYEEKYSKYLQDNLFDNNTNCIIEGDTYGRLSQFYTLNNKKPLLGYMTTNTNEIHLINKDEVLRIFYLKQYMDIIKAEKINNDVGSISYTMNFNSSTKKWSLDSYKNTPYKTTDNLENNIYIHDVLLGKNQEVIIKKYSQLTKYILQLTDFKVKGFYSDKDNTDGKFKTFASIYYKHINDLNNSNFSRFKTVYKSLMSDLLRLYIYDEDIYKVKNIINFNVCMTDYLFNTSIREEFVNTMDIIKNKILELKQNYIIENDDEFFILCGQMAKYLKLKTQTKEKTNKLFYEYLAARKTKKLITILERDKARLDYDNVIGSRSDKIMYGLLKYYSDNKDNLRLIDITKLHMGLYYGDCLLYSSNKNNENKKGDK